LGRALDWWMDGGRRGSMVETKESFHIRWIPRDIESFIRSYFEATELKTPPTGGFELI